jgi:hypothetical protein
MSHQEVPTGHYRHFRGGEYDVLGEARHSETDEHLIVYQARYGARELWARPKAMFTEMVEHGGKQVPRFTKLD